MRKPERPAQTVRVLTIMLASEYEQDRAGFTVRSFSSIDIKRLSRAADATPA
jgi:hypothetical protein